jgi:hypothetical protein
MRINPLIFYNLLILAQEFRGRQSPGSCPSGTDRAQHHGLLVVVLQMAGFIAVDIEGFAHCIPLTPP